MTRFADRAAAGEALAAAVSERGPWPDAVVIAVEPTGRPVAEPVARILDAELLPLPAARVDDGPRIGRLPAVRDRVAILVDAGVETGALAHAAAAKLRTRGPQRLVLAVPVCPREALATLQLVFDDVIAVQQPLVRRSLRWHYDTLE